MLQEAWRPNISPAQLARLLALVVLMGAAAPGAEAQTGSDRMSGYVTVTSDYRNRGLSQSRGEPALLIGGDYQHESGIFAGVWGATVEYAAGTQNTGSRRNEIAYYAGYSRQVEDWSFAGTVNRYTYPGSALDYDYTELTGSVDYRGRIFYSASYTADLYGREVSASHQELGVTFPIRSDVELSAAVGRFAADDFDIAYTHWNAGVSKTLRRLGLDLRYYDDDYGFDGPLGMPGAGDWVLSLSYGFDAP